MSKRKLIEDWLPMAALSEECVRERRSMTALPPTYYLHVWFARRPLVASRAAILASLLEANADRGTFLHDIGIHGDPVASKTRIAAATAKGERLGAEAYGYPRAFQYLPPSSQAGATVLDPTAGGGSIPFEAARIGASVVGNDLNPVAALLLKTTLELPLEHGTALLNRVRSLGAHFLEHVRAAIADVYPDEPNGWICDGYLWARTVTCPYCGGLVPLSPTWKLSSNGKGVRLVPENGRVRFEIVDRDADHSPGTVKGGDGLCPFPECLRTIDGDEVKAQAQAGRMGHQLYAVVYKEEIIKGYTKNGKPKTEKVRGFRGPRLQDDVETLVGQRLQEKMPLWRAQNIVPDEEIDPVTNDHRPHQYYGMKKWSEMFSPRQILGHCTAVDARAETGWWPRGFVSIPGKQGRPHGRVFQERRRGADVQDCQVDASTFPAYCNTPLALDVNVRTESLHC